MLIYNENMLAGIGQHMNIEFEKEWQLRENIIKSILEKIGIVETSGNITGLLTHSMGINKTS